MHVVSMHVVSMHCAQHAIIVLRARYTTASVVQCLCVGPTPVLGENLLSQEVPMTPPPPRAPPPTPLPSTFLVLPVGIPKEQNQPNCRAGHSCRAQCGSDGDVAEAVIGSMTAAGTPGTLSRGNKRLASKAEINPPPLWAWDSPDYTSSVAAKHDIVPINDTAHRPHRSSCEQLKQRDNPAHFVRA